MDFEIYLAFRNGVAHVMPAFATSMIELLGASPAEDFCYYEPQQKIIIRHQRGSAPVLGGNGVKASRRLDMYEEERKYAPRSPRRSWKHYRNTRWRRLATAEEAQA